ncbi:malto-oligosyltrehalose trehalohydrolase [Demequina aurantiaca]|uniref:malto-oligosyltrehalose trehalohydrolase n=1 Tax=Demequina aurantiaca TaxID=676200 RepID=UPI003D3445B0
MLARVWAPHAANIVCVAAVGGVEQRLPMQLGDDGWWSGPELVHGANYGYEVDGDGPWPDPRSAAQPDGVHALSRVFDTGLHRWTDSEWTGVDALGSVFYELHIGAFTPQGTLDAAAAQLPALKSIGVDIVELMPVAPFPGRHGWGYDGVALFGVHQSYGGPAALQRFVDAAHRAGLGVCLDVVYNHLGPDGNYLSKFGPYFTDVHHTPWGWAVNLDQPDADGMRRFVCDNALRWFSEFHIDCLRLDAVHELKDDSPQHVLAQLSDEVATLADRIGRPLSLVAESDLNDDVMVTPTAQGGYGMTAQWNDDVHHALHSYLTGERHGYYTDFGSVEALDKVYREVFWHNGTYSPFRDANWGKPVDPARDRRRFVVCASNHDQVGNRAIGDRPSTTLTAGAQAASLAFILLSPFTPMLFMGEEYGETRPFMFFTDHDEPLGSAVSEGRMSEFGGHGWEELYGHEIHVPDPQDRITFLRSKLGDGVAAEGSEHDALRTWELQLMALRPRIQPRDRWDAHPPGVSESSPRVVTMHGPLAVHANLSEDAVTIDTTNVVATFGEVTVDADGRAVLEPDAIVVEAP